MLGALIDDPDLLDVLNLLFARRTATATGLRPLHGLAQGSPLSPMLANLVLTHLDERLLGAGFPIVRYADDLALLATDRDEAWEALRVANRAASSWNPPAAAGPGWTAGCCWPGDWSRWVEWELIRPTSALRGADRRARCRSREVHGCARCPYRS